MLLTEEDLYLTREDDLYITREGCIRLRVDSNHVKNTIVPIYRADDDDKKESIQKCRVRSCTVFKIAGGKQEMPPPATRQTKKDSECQPFDQPAAEYMRQHRAEVGLSAKDFACLEALLTKAGGKDHVWVEGSNDNGSLAAMSERLRATLCMGLYRELKMVHCEPRLLLHLCTTHSIEQPENLAAYVRSSGVTDHGKMIADLLESNPRAVREDVERVVVQLVHGTPLREALESEEQKFSDSTPDVKWLPQLENEIQKVHLQLKDKLSNSGDTTMQVQPGEESANDNEEESEDEGMKYADDGMEDGEEPILVNTKAGDSARAKEAAAIVSKELGDLQNRCLDALDKYLRKRGAIHKRGDGESARCDDSIMIRDTKKNRELTGQDFLNKANNAVKEATGFRPTIKIRHFRDGDGYPIPAQVKEKVERRQRLIRELALQGQPLDADDANHVMVCIMKILAVESFGEHVETEFHTVVAEWLERAGETPFKNPYTLTEWSSTIRDFAEHYASWLPKRCTEASGFAWSALHARRKQRPLLAFKHDLVPVSRQDEDEDKYASIVLRDLLQNVDTHGTAIRSLVLVARLLWPQQDAKVFEWLKSHYPKEQSDGLDCEDTFKGVWTTPVPDGVQHDLKNALSQHIEIALTSPPFILSDLPTIMEQPVVSYTKRERELFFTLDYSPVTEEFRLDFTTGEITSSQGRGVLHNICKGVRECFLEIGGVQATAKLLQAGKISDKMRYDACTGGWKVCVASTGLWRPAEKEEAIAVVSTSLRSLLEPIKHMVEMVGSDKFDWVRGTYAPVVDDDSSDADVDSSDEDVNNGGKSEKIPPGPGKKRPPMAQGKQGGKKKARVSTQGWTGHQALKTVDDMMRKYVETPMNTAQVLIPLQTTLKHPFSERSEDVPLVQRIKCLIQQPVSAVIHSQQQLLMATGGHLKSMENETQLAEVFAAYRSCLGESAQTEGDAIDADGIDPGGLHLKKDRVTANLSPVDQMHVALVQNMGPCDDWRRVVVWTCLLVAYQAQVKTNTEAEESDRQGKRAADKTSSFAVELSDADATMPEVLQDFWTKRLHGHGEGPTEQEFRHEGKQIHTRIMECDESNRMLIGRALWSVCFDELFSYQAGKTKLEQTTFKVKDTMAYFVVSSEGTAIQYSAATMASFHKSESYWGIAGPKDQEIEGSGSRCYSLQNEYEILRFQRFSLVDRWMRDPNALTFDRLDSVPPSRDGSAAPTGVYNTWPGFHAEGLPPVAEAEVVDLVQPILDHLFMLLGTQEGFGYLLAWLAQMVQDPSKPTNVAILLQGQQGIGKDIIFEEFFCQKVLGTGTAFTTAKPQSTIFGEFSAVLQNRVFLLLDEVSADAMRPVMELFKDLITSSTTNINPKNKTAYIVRNLSNTLCTTNTKNPFHIEPQDRRFVVFECRRTKQGDTAYFQSLGDHLKRPEVARAFFQYLRDHVDVGPYTPFQVHRPQTSAYVAMQQRNIPLFYKFLSAQIEHATGVANEEHAVLKGKEAFERFQAWGRQGNYNIQKTNITNFGTDMTKLAEELTENDSSQDVFIKLARTSAGQTYRVNWGKLRTFLQQEARYDPNAVM